MMRKKKANEALSFFQKTWKYERERERDYFITRLIMRSK